MALIIIIPREIMNLVIGQFKDSIKMKQILIMGLINNNQVLIPKTTITKTATILPMEFTQLILKMHTAKISQK